MTEEITSTPSSASAPEVTKTDLEIVREIVGKTEITDDDFKTIQQIFDTTIDAEVIMEIIKKDTISKIINYPVRMNFFIACINSISTIFYYSDYIDEELLKQHIEQYIKLATETISSIEIIKNNEYCHITFIEGLGKIGSNPKISPESRGTILHIIQKYLSDPEHRYYCISALGKIGSNPKITLDFLQTKILTTIQGYLLDPNYTHRCISALGKIGSNPKIELQKEIFTTIQRYLSDPKYTKACIYTLGEIGSNPKISPKLQKEIFTTIQRYLSDPKYKDVHRTCIIALGKINSNPKISLELQKEIFTTI